MSDELAVGKRKDDDLQGPPPPPPQQATPAEEVVALRIRLWHVEQEVWGLRRAKHEHAGLITAILGHIEVMRRDLDRLKPLATEVAAMRERVEALEEEVRGAKEQLSELREAVDEIDRKVDAHAASLETKLAPLANVEPRLKKLERRLEVVGAVALVVTSLLQGLAAHYFPPKPPAAAPAPAATDR